MKFTWEEDDIKGGRDVIDSAGVHCILGYIPGTDKHTPDRRWTIVSLDDGMILEFQTKSGLAQKLTEDYYIPVKVP